MANSFCTLAQLYAVYDYRTLSQLSNDNNQREAVETRIQTIMDMQASELESMLAGRFALPLSVVPLVLTKWVAVTTAARMFARRADAPKGFDRDLKWADDFMKNLMDGQFQLNGVDRAKGPALHYSEYTDGRSRFDQVANFDRPPSDTSTSRGS